MGVRESTVLGWNEHRLAATLSPMSTNALESAADLTRREQELSAHSRYAGRMDLSDKLGAIRAAVSAFDQGSIAYALIGGLAVGIRSGVPRATLDVDFAVYSSVSRTQLCQLFATHGFITTGDFAHSVNFRSANTEPVQVAFDPSFDAIISRAEAMQFGELIVRVVTKRDLIELKRRAANDPSRRRSKALRDQADIALLEGDVPDPDEGW